MIFNEIKCGVNTSLGLVGGCIPCTHPPCVRTCAMQTFLIFMRTAMLDSQIVNLSGLGWLLVQWSVTQNDVSLIITSTVRYHVVYKHCYETWSRKCIIWFDSKVAKIVFFLESIQILVRFNLQKFPPWKWNTHPKSCKSQNFPPSP